MMMVFKRSRRPTHMPSLGPRLPTPSQDRSGRLALAIVAFLAVYGAITGRLIQLGLAEPEAGRHYVSEADQRTLARPNFTDRNGEILATDIEGASLFAEPRRVSNVDEAVTSLVSVFPDINQDRLRRVLSTDAGFAWVKREISPAERKKVHRLGIPGLDFRSENRRYYPGDNLVGHILGTVSVDNRGISGLEKYIDDVRLKPIEEAGFVARHDQEPVALSLDLRVQAAVHSELTAAMERYQAIAAMGVVLKADTGEVMAMVSLPDFDPHDREEALKTENLNRVTAGVFEMGSVFKAFNTAMALDSGRVHIDESFDATKPLQIGGFSIGDFHGKYRWLTVPEVFIYSSNIGSARMALALGHDGQQAYLERLGLTSKIETELPEVARPIVPKKWSDITAATVAFGHGISVSPMNTAVAAAAIVNGGKLLPPTFLPRSTEDAEAIGVQVISPQTSAHMRELFAMNARRGSGRRARVEGFEVGGKTGTAEKITNGRYDSSKRFNSYLSAFPISDPQYVVLVVIDEPKPEKPGIGATAGLNSAPTVSRIVRRIGPMLGVQPRFGTDVTTMAAN